MLHEAFQDPPIGRELSPLLPVIFLSFLCYNCVCIAHLWYHTESSLRSGTEFYSSLYLPKASSQAAHTCGKKGWVMPAPGPTPTSLFPLTERGQITPLRQHGTACLEHLGDLWWPPVQGSLYLNKVGIYRTRSCTPGWADTKVSRDVSQALSTKIKDALGTQSPHTHEL